MKTKRWSVDEYNTQYIEDVITYTISTYPLHNMLRDIELAILASDIIQESLSLAAMQY